MKPLPSNQPFSNNDINYIVLLSLQHPAIKSNHGSLANLFMHEAAVSFLLSFHSPPPFFALHEHDVHYEGCTVPKPLHLRGSAQSHRAPWNAPLKYSMSIGGHRPALGLNLSQFSRSTISGAQSGFMAQSWQKQHEWLRKSPPSTRGKSWLLLLGHPISVQHNLGIYHTGAWNMLPRVCAQENSPENFFVYLGDLL